MSYPQLILARGVRLHNLEISTFQNRLNHYLADLSDAAKMLYVVAGYIIFLGLNWLTTSLINFVDYDFSKLFANTELGVLDYLCRIYQMQLNLNRVTSHRCITLDEGHFNLVLY
jgi:hypothetical protein